MGRSGLGRRGLSALLGVLFVVLAACSPAGAFVYWDNYDYAIGRANLDGSGQVAKFASLSGTPCGVAMDGRYVYWADHLYDSIGRAPIDGVGQATDSYITGLDAPCGVAVYDHHLYWANEGGYNSTGSIGRADLVGPLDVRQNFIPNTFTGSTSGYSQFCGIDVDGSGIYWADNNLNAIARANLDGTGAGVLVQGASSPCGVTLVGGHVLWTNGGSGTIGVALTNGAGVDQNFITGQYQPCGLAAYGGYLYWTSNSHQWGGGTVNRVPLNSTNPTAEAETIVMGIPSPCGVAVDGLFVGALKVISAKPVAGGVQLSLNVSAPGGIDAKQATPGANLIQRDTRIASHPGTVLLRLRLTPAGRNSSKHHPARIRLLVTFHPTGGLQASRTIWVVVR